MAFTDEDCDLIWTNRFPAPAPGQHRISCKKYVELYRAYTEALRALAKAKNPSGPREVPDLPK